VNHAIQTAQQPPGALALSEPKYEAFVQHYVACGGARAEAARLAGVTVVTAKKLLNDQDVVDRIRFINAQQFREIGVTAERVKQELAYAAFQNAADLFDADGNLIPVHALPDEVARTITQIEVEVRDKLVKDEDGNPTVESVTVKKIKRVDKLAALTLFARHFKIVGAEDDGVNMLASALADRLNAAKRRVGEPPPVDEVIDDATYPAPRAVVTDSSADTEARIIGEGVLVQDEPATDTFASPEPPENDDEIW